MAIASADDLGPPGLLDAGPSWCTHRSLLDILDPCLVMGVHRTPFTPPFAQYLDEVHMSLKHGPGDPSYTGSVGSGGGKSPVKLAGIMQGADGLGIQVGVCLLWIAVAGVFGYVPAIVIDDFKEELAKHWYLFSLKVMQVLEHEHDAKDWVFAAFPVVYAQAIYRILVDAFEEDRKQLTSNCITLLEKLTLVIHFELTGFQVTENTVRKARRNLLVKHVLQNPQQNRLEFLRGVARQQQLETETSSNGTVPLSFGRLEGGRPLEETQLEHVMFLRQAEKRRTAAMESRPIPLVVESDEDMMTHEEQLYRDLPRPRPYRPPAGLGVDSYTGLAAIGASMQEQHMAVYNKLFEDASKKDAGEYGDTPRSEAQALGSKVNLKLGSKPQEEPVATLGQPEGPRPSRGWNLLRNSYKVGHYVAVAEKEKAKKDKQAKLRRMQHEALHNDAATKPLPPALSERALNTTWVSPMTKKLVPDEKDRCILRKGSADTFPVKMTRNPFPMQKFTHRTASLPGLVGDKTTSDMVAMSSSGGAGSSDQLVPSGRPDAGGKGKSPSGGEVTMTLDPPQNLRKKVILQRLEAQAVAFRKNSFGEYTKEYDVLTGDRKQRFDAPRLRRAENEYLAKMDLMVGGPPKRLVPLRSKAKLQSSAIALPSQAVAACEK